MTLKEKAKKELQIIEHQNRTWLDKFKRNQSIWYDIVVQINSHKGKKQGYWIMVMELYHEKYNNNEK